MVVTETKRWPNFYIKLPKGLVLEAGLVMSQCLFPQGLQSQRWLWGWTGKGELADETCSPAHCCRVKLRPAVARTFNCSKESRHLVF